MAIEVREEYLAVCRLERTPRYKPRQDRWDCQLEEIAKEFGVSREAIRQTEIRALKKCRQWCEENGVSLDDLLKL